MFFQDMAYTYTRKTVDETFVKNFLDIKLKALTEPMINDDIFDTCSTGDVTVYECPESKLHHINSTLILVSERTDKDENDGEAYHIRNINDIKL